MGHSLETKQRAYDLFVERGLTYDEVARETGVSLSTLKQWGGEGDWLKKRGEFEREFLQLHANFQKLKLKLTAEALDTGDPQKIYALATLHRATSLNFRGGGEDKAALALEWLQKLIAFLKERDADALKYLHPHLSAFAEELRQTG